MDGAITLVTNALARCEAWIAGRDALLAKAATVKAVDTPESLQEAGALLSAMKTQRKSLEAERKAVTAPADAWKADIMGQEKVLAAALETETARVKALCDGYATREAAKAEAERRAAAEKARQEEEARARAEQAARTAAAEAMRAANAAERERLAKAEAERQAEARRLADIAAAEAKAREALAPKAAPLKTAANRMVTRWTFEVVAPRDVPRMYCCPDPAAIRAYIKAVTEGGGEPVMPGVTFAKTVSVETK